MPSERKGILVRPRDEVYIYLKAMADGQEVSVNKIITEIIDGVVYAQLEIAKNKTYFDELQKLDKKLGKKGRKYAK